MRTSVREGESPIDHQQEMLARIDNPRSTQIPGWLSIETAPLDGSLIRVRDGKWSPCHARFKDGHWSFVEFTSFLPTLWQPYPTPEVKP